MAQFLDLTGLGHFKDKNDALYAKQSIVAVAFDATMAYVTGDYCVYNNILYRFKADKTAGAWDSTKATAVAITDDVADLKSAINDIRTLSIDGYIKDVEEVNGTLVNNAFWDNSNNAVAINGWSYLTVNCESGKTYYISGTGSTAGRLYYAIDRYDNIIDSAPSAGTIRFNDVEYVAPIGAVKIIVNALNSHGAASVKAATWNFVNENGSKIGVETNTDIWEIGSGNFKNTVNLHGTANGTFNYTKIYYKGNEFKTAGDDVAPLSLLSAGYVGANHGYVFVYTITATAHGLTASDIGKTYEGDDGTWVLLKVFDADTFQVGCRNPNVWFGIKRVTAVPNSFNFGTTINVESSALAQLLPSVRNVSVVVVKNTKDIFEVAESYDIIDPSVGIAWIISNVGSATNDSIVEHSDSALTLRNLYQFDKWGGCTITHSVEALKAVGLEFYSGSQSQAFGASDYYCIPKTTFASIRDVSETQYFDRSTWDSNSVPPKVYLQCNGKVSTTTKMMLCGVDMDGRNDTIDYTAGFVYASSRKMYPFAIQPNKTLAVGDVYSFRTYRIPMYLYDVDSGIQYAGFCKINKKYYVFCWTAIATKGVLKVPEEMYGLNASIIYGEYATLKNQYVADAVEIETTRQGSILIELS